MVTTRGADSFADVQKTKIEEYLDKYGQGSFIRTRQTPTTDAEGNVSALNPKNLPVKGKMQFVTVKDYQILKEGIARLGDGIFYTLGSYDVVVDDEITTPSGEIYRITAKLEGEKTAGQEIYQGFACVRLPDS